MAIQGRQANPNTRWGEGRRLLQKASRVTLVKDNQEVLLSGQASKRPVFGETVISPAGESVIERNPVLSISITPKIETGHHIDRNPVLEIDLPWEPENRNKYKTGHLTLIGHSPGTGGGPWRCLCTVYECCGLLWNVSFRFMYLNTWSPDGEAVWEGYRASGKRSLGEWNGSQG